MRIREVHAIMKMAGELPEGPLTDPRTGQRRMQNRGVAREWRNVKRSEALSRESNVNHLRTRKHRLNKCDCVISEGRNKITNKFH